MSTHVVSWNDAAEMNESVESDAFVIRSSSGRPCAGRSPLLIRLSKDVEDVVGLLGSSGTMMIFRWPCESVAPVYC